MVSLKLAPQGQVNVTSIERGIAAASLFASKPVGRKRDGETAKRSKKIHRACAGLLARHAE